MNIKRLNEEIEGLLQDSNAISEATYNTRRDQIDFDTVGSAIQIFVDPYHGYEPETAAIGLNGIARGNIYFISSKLKNKEDRKTVYAWKEDMKQKVEKFLIQAVSEFDAKVDSFMKELGFIREQ